MPRFKDDSNERILKMIESVQEEMNKEDRGFIFAPMIQPTGDHRSFVVVADKKGHTLDETMMMFWATMASIIINVNTQIPEDKREEFKFGFMAFIETCCQQAFPSLEDDD